jgi:hypothetical protein
MNSRSLVKGTFILLNSSLFPTPEKTIRLNYFVLLPFYRALCFFRLFMVFATVIARWLWLLLLMALI